MVSWRKLCHVHSFHKSCFYDLCRCRLVCWAGLLVSRISCHYQLMESLLDFFVYFLGKWLNGPNQICALLISCLFSVLRWLQFFFRELYFFSFIEAHPFSGVEDEGWVQMIQQTLNWCSWIVLNLVRAWSWACFFSCSLIKREIISLFDKFDRRLIFTGKSIQTYFIFKYTKISNPKLV